MKRTHIALARDLRNRMTDAERLLWRHVRGRHFQQWKFRRQHSLSHYIVDFVCLSARLVIELDGGQHLENVWDDEERTKALRALGFRVIRFWNDDVLTRTDAVLEEILKALSQVPPHPDPLLGSRVQRSPSNPALGILPQAFDSAADAFQGIGQARCLTPVGERERCSSYADTSSCGYPQ